MFFALLVLSAMLASAMVASNLKINKREKDLNSRMEVLKEEIKSLEEKNKQLRAEIDQTQNQDYTEKILRDNLNYKKPGEDVVVIKSATDTANGAEEQLEEKNFWKKIWEKLGL